MAGTNDWDDGYMAPHASTVMTGNTSDFHDQKRESGSTSSRNELEQKELDEATVRYETLLHAMAHAQTGNDDFQAHLAFLDSDGDEESNNQGTHHVVSPREVVAGGQLMRGGVQVVEPKKTNMMMTQAATVISKPPKPPPSRVSRYEEDEDLADFMDVINISSAIPDPEPQEENSIEQSNMENYRQWIPDTVPPGEEEINGEGSNLGDGEKISSEESNPDGEGDKKKLSLRDMRKQAAAVTGIHGFGKKAIAAKEGAASKAKGAAKHTISVFKKGVSQEGTDKARRATMLGVMGSEGVGSPRYQFSEERAPDMPDMTQKSENEFHETPEQKKLRVATAAHKFAKLGKLDGLTNWLEKQGFKPCELDRHDGWSLLHTAAEAGHGSIVAWVVRYHEPLLAEDGSVISGGNIPVSAKTGQGWTAAHVAAAHGHEEVLEVLSELDADLQMVDNSGASPLHSAAGSGCIAAIRTLASHGCDLDAVTNDGATATYVAAGNGFDNVVRLLGELGADVNIPTYDGWTPAQIANEMGATKVLHALSDLVVASLQKMPHTDNPTPASRPSARVQDTPSPEPRAPSRLPTCPEGFVYREVRFTEAHPSMNIMIAAGVGNFPIVTKVNEGSPCKEAGVMPQDLIVGVTPSVNFVPPTDPDDELSRLYPGELLLLRTHDEALSILPRSGRPVTVTFMSRIEEEVSTEPWACGLCTFENEGASTSCSMCGQPKSTDATDPAPLPPAVPVQSPKSPVPPSHAEWECGVCTFHNKNTSVSCEMCGTPNPIPPPAKAPIEEPVRQSTRPAVIERIPSSTVTNWRQVESDEYPGQFYYLNDVTGEAQWERPAELRGGVVPPPPVSTPPHIDNTEEYYGVDYPIDVAQWIHDCCNLSAVQEMKLLDGLCGPDSNFGVMELSDLNDIEGPYLSKLLDLVPIAKRKKFERELRALRGE